MWQQEEENPIRYVKIEYETCCISSNQVDALHDILQLLLLDAGLNNGDTLMTVLTLMEFHKIDKLGLHCNVFSYSLDVKTLEEPK